MDKICKKCIEADDIFIYGAGTIAGIFYLYLKNLSLDHKMRAFVVSARKDNPYKKFDKEVLELGTAQNVMKESYVIVATQKSVQEEIVKGLLDRGITHADCVLEMEMLDDLYKDLYKKPISNNKILFSNMRGMGYGGNPKYIARKLIEMDKEKELDLVWVVSDEKYNFPDRIRTVKQGTLDYYMEVATARVWIDNVRKDGDIKKREGQYYIQAWHGAAPIKRVEMDVPDSLSISYINNAKKDSAMADLFLSGSEFYTQLYKRAFWYDGEIMEIGLPRQDVFWDMSEARKKVLNFYDIEEKKKIVLYAPTFRKEITNTAYALDIPMVIEALENRFGGEFEMLISKHPNNRYLDYAFDENSKYMDVAGYEDFEELLATADILISDYSGCMYDYSFTGRPIFLYQSDYEDYVADRDFYFSMDELPYITARSNDELINKIENFDENTYGNAIKNFMESMGNFDKGEASVGVAKHIWKVIFGDI